MSENNKTTTTSGSHPHEQDQQQTTKNGEQRHQIVNDEEETPSDNSRSMGSADQQPKIGEQKNGADKDEETPADNPLPMENSAADEPTAHHEHVHQQNKPNTPQESKTNMNQQQEELEGLEEIRMSRPPLSISEQFDKFNRAEANGVASRVAPYYWRPIPPALKKLNGMDRYNVRPGWKSPPPSPSKDVKDGEP